MIDWGSGNFQDLLGMLKSQGVGGRKPQELPIQRAEGIETMPSIVDDTKFNVGIPERGMPGWENPKPIQFREPEPSAGVGPVGSMKPGLQSTIVPNLLKKSAPVAPQDLGGGAAER